MLWLMGLDDAWINPAWMDLAPYDAIYLGTPIWRGCPAPPAWEFVRATCSLGKGRTSHYIQRIMEAVSY